MKLVVYKVRKSIREELVGCVPYMNARGELVIDSDKLVADPDVRKSFVTPPAAEQYEKSVFTSADILAGTIKDVVTAIEGKILIPTALQWIVSPIGAPYTSSVNFWFGYPSDADTGSGLSSGNGPTDDLEADTPSPGGFASLLNNLQQQSPGGNGWWAEQIGQPIRMGLFGANGTRDAKFLTYFRVVESDF